MTETVLDFPTIFRFIMALTLVLGLILALSWAARRYGFGLLTPEKGRRRKRLAIIESASLDARRRLVLIRRDDTEHLLLVGGTADMEIGEGRPVGSAEVLSLQEADSLELREIDKRARA